MHRPEKHQNSTVYDENCLLNEKYTKCGTNSPWHADVVG